MINPTRLELIRLKRKLKISQRGHKLLKDKRDGLMREFISIIKEAYDCRREVEQKISLALQNFLFASSLVSQRELEEATIWPNLKIILKVKPKNIMNVKVPEFNYEIGGKHYKCYSSYSVPREIDNSLKVFQKALPSLVKLAQLEHRAKLLSFEIEKTRRRVNVLEYVFIPGIEKNIKYITSKLDEQEKSALIALMKAKQKLIGQ